MAVNNTIQQDDKEPFSTVTKQTEGINLTEASISTKHNVHTMDESGHLRDKISEHYGNFKYRTE